MTKDQERRAKENADLIDRMNKGESLARYTHEESWWQPRPIIKKDYRLMAQLHGGVGPTKRTTSEGFSVLKAVPIGQ